MQQCLDFQKKRKGEGERWKSEVEARSRKNEGEERSWKGDVGSAAPGRVVPGRAGRAVAFPCAWLMVPRPSMVTSTGRRR